MSLPDPTKQEVLAWYRKVAREEVKKVLGEISPKQRRTLQEGM